MSGVAWKSTLAAAALAAAICGVAAAQGYPAQIPSAYGFTVDPSSLGPSPMYPGAWSVWVTYDPGGTSFDCSPPRGCYAKTQRINYTFGCAPGYAMVTQRISYDLNGNVVNNEVQNIQSANPSTYDAGGRLVIATYCSTRIPGVQ